MQTLSYLFGGGLYCPNLDCFHIKKIKKIDDKVVMILEGYFSGIYLKILGEALKIHHIF